MSEWSSKLGFIFAAIGAAVGLGNIWRFPVTVNENGGAAFFFPYLVITFTFGLGLMIVEISGGQQWGVDVVSIFEKLKNGIFGYVVAGVVTAILSYYMVITGWVFGFVWIAANGFQTTFTEFTNMTAAPMILWAVSILLIGAIVSLGIDDGIERAVSILIPILFIIIVILVLVATQLPGFSKGVAYYLNPDFSQMLNIGVWDSAFGQAFFSLSIAQGILLTYGTYLGGDTNVPRTSVIIAIANFFIAFLFGLVIFPIAFSVPGFDIHNLQNGGKQLAFSVLPEVFHQMPGGIILGTVFYALMALAAVSSAVALFEVGTAVAIGRGMTRRKAVGYMMGILFILGFPSALSYTGVGFEILGMRFFEFVDQSMGDYGLPIGGIITAVGFTWWQKERVVKSDFIYYLIKYILPVVLILTMLATFLTEGI
ncbi:MAG: sodium-dependent transporter [Halobacteria archaeon]